MGSKVKKPVRYKIVEACEYYGDHAVGHVVLADGYPVYHETDARTSLQDCQDFIKEVKS